MMEMVLHEYPIDRASMFLTGHSMGSGGAWYTQEVIRCRIVGNFVVNILVLERGD